MSLRTIVRPSFRAFLCLAFVPFLPRAAATATEDIGTAGAAASELEIVLSPQAFFEGIQQGRFDAIVDVRSLEEWNEGHIAGATLVESLASPVVASPRLDALVGCEYCSLALYCRTGARAAQAIRVLRDAGFQGRLHNAMGVSSWVEAGYPLTTEAPSIVPPCHSLLNVSESCHAHWLTQGMPGATLAFVRQDPLLSEEQRRVTTDNSSSTTLPPSEFPILFPDDLFEGIQDGSFSVILDVRTEVTDWATTGRLPNSTILSELFITSSLNGCEFCDIVVYGDSLVQVEQALKALVVANFQGQLYNGLTVNDYVNAGYSLVVEPSVIPACVSNDSVCRPDASAPPNTLAPSTSTTNTGLPTAEQTLSPTSSRVVAPIEDASQAISHYARSSVWIALAAVAAGTWGWVELAAA